MTTGLRDMSIYPPPPPQSLIPIVYIQAVQGSLS